MRTKATKKPRSKTNSKVDDPLTVVRKHLMEEFNKKVDGITDLKKLSTMTVKIMEQNKTSDNLNQQQQQQQQQQQLAPIRNSNTQVLSHPSNYQQLNQLQNKANYFNYCDFASNINTPASKNFTSLYPYQSTYYKNPSVSFPKIQQQVRQNQWMNNPTLVYQQNTSQVNNVLSNLQAMVEKYKYATPDQKPIIRNSITSFIENLRNAANTGATNTDVTRAIFNYINNPEIKGLLGYSDEMIKNSFGPTIYQNFMDVANNTIGAIGTTADFGRNLLNLRNAYNQGSLWNNPQQTIGNIVGLTQNLGNFGTSLDNGWKSFKSIFGYGRVGRRIPMWKLYRRPK